MKTFTTLSLIFFVGLAGLSASAEIELKDLHLKVVSRTAEEAARISKVTKPTTDFSKPEPFEANSAGAATVRARATSGAFSQPSANISFESELDFKVGNGLFKKLISPGKRR